VVAAVLTQVNVWIDVVFTTLYPIILLALALHFMGNVLTKRAYRRFVKHEWPQHEGGPIPALPKVLHFEHVACMIALAVSGLFIRFPTISYSRTPMQWIHYVAMIVVILNLIWRLQYAFFSPRRDWREFAVTSRDITTAPKVIAYYLFLIPPAKKPHLGKYNVMQKMTYIIFVPLLIVQALTGFALLTQALPFVGLSPREVLLGLTAGPFVGGIDAAGAWARTTHYLINWLFIVLTTIHVYLSVTEDFPAFQDFFGMGGAHDDAEAGDHGPGGYVVPDAVIPPALAVNPAVPVAAPVAVAPAAAVAAPAVPYAHAPVAAATAGGIVSADSMPMPDAD
jgi:Ni,Fe-hydrogenase I cytochrome b subunit